MGLLDISCVSALICYAVASGPAGYSHSPVPVPGRAGSASSVWMTSDGGTSQPRQSVPPGVGCTNGDCAKLLFPDPLEWVWVWQRAVPGGGGILRRRREQRLRVRRRRGDPSRRALDDAHVSTRVPVLQRPDGYPSVSPRRAVLARRGRLPTSARCYGVSSISSGTEPGITEGVGYAGPGPVSWSADGGELWLAGPSGAGSIRTAIACPAAGPATRPGTRG